jgi:hypothetical protein
MLHLSMGVVIACNGPCPAAEYVKAKVPRPYLLQHSAMLKPGWGLCIPAPIHSQRLSESLPACLPAGSHTPLTQDYMAPEVLRCPQKHKPLDNKVGLRVAVIKCLLFKWSTKETEKWPWQGCHQIQRLQIGWLVVPLLLCGPCLYFCHGHCIACPGAGRPRLHSRC